MESYLCSVQVDREKCIAVSALRQKLPGAGHLVRQGKAQIISDKCIDCGECIRFRPPRAIEGLADPLDRLKDYRVNLALSTFPVCPVPRGSASVHFMGRLGEIGLAQGL